jgi:hypothetical protein
MKDKKIKLTIEFDNQLAATHFALWLCEQGEQEYWEWMRCRESDDKDEDRGVDITATGFHYHGPEDETKDRTDPARYGDFMCDNTIRTTCGRLKK